MSWEQELKTTLETMMSTDTFTNKRCDDLKADVKRLIEKTMQHEQKLINLNHKFKMLMYYLEVDYNKVVEKYNNKDKGENNAR